MWPFCPFDLHSCYIVATKGIRQVGRLMNWPLAQTTVQWELFYKQFTDET